MNKLKIISGVILILLGALFYTFAKEAYILISLILTIAGLALIIFSRTKTKPKMIIKQKKTKLK